MTQSTRQNLTSSRSHAILQFTVEQQGSPELVGDNSENAPVSALSGLLLLSCQRAGTELQRWGDGKTFLRHMGERTIQIYDRLMTCWGVCGCR
jgi:hypothetical protein